MPDVLHENASVHSPYTRDTVVLKEGGTCIPLKDESGKRSMPGLVARETESLPKGDPNSIYYERARQSDLDDVDGWPALSVCCLLSVPFCAIGLVLCIPTFLSFCFCFLHLILFSSSDPVFPLAKTISFGRRPATCQSCIQTHVHDLMKDLKTSSASRVMKDLRTSSFVPSPKGQHTHTCMYSHLVTTHVHLNFDIPII